jgi:hypothetical protein
MKRGDIILYKASPDVWYEQLIAQVTHGPFVHTSIVCDEQYCLAATTAGINLAGLPHEDAQHVVIAIDPSLNIEAGLDWAKLQIGRKYGWTDIVYQGVKFLAPNNPFQFGHLNEWDCSDYVTRYLQHIGYAIPDNFADPYANTPNDLARIFNLLPMRKGAAP